MLETIGNIDNMSLKQLEIVSCVQKVACVEILNTIESVSKIHHWLVPYEFVASNSSL